MRVLLSFAFIAAVSAQYPCVDACAVGKHPSSDEMIAIVLSGQTTEQMCAQYTAFPDAVAETICVVQTCDSSTLTSVKTYFGPTCGIANALALQPTCTLPPCVNLCTCMLYFIYN